MRSSQWISKKRKIRRQNTAIWTIMSFVRRRAWTWIRADTVNAWRTISRRIQWHTFWIISWANHISQSKQTTHFFHSLSMFSMWILFCFVQSPSLQICVQCAPGIRHSKSTMVVGVFFFYRHKHTLMHVHIKHFGYTFKSLTVWKCLSWKWQNGTISFWYGCCTSYWERHCCKCYTAQKKKHEKKQFEENSHQSTEWKRCVRMLVCVCDVSGNARLYAESECPKKKVFRSIFQICRSQDISKWSDIVETVFKKCDEIEFIFEAPKKPLVNILLFFDVIVTLKRIAKFNVASDLKSIKFFFSRSKDSRKRSVRMHIRSNQSARCSTVRINRRISIATRKLRVREFI